jgi:hypothetical protein
MALVATPTYAASLVSVGSPSTSFPRNQQNEPALAVDPTNPNVLVAGANDAIDLAPCEGSNCLPSPSFAPSVNGVYFSFDGGSRWTQPTYSGNSARSGVLDPSGPTGTVPWYGESGWTTDGDPALAFGPAPGADGKFRWSNGSRLYYLALAADLAHGPHLGNNEGSIKGFIDVAVSHTDNVSTASLGGTTGKNAWSRPVLISSRNSTTTGNDKEATWADNAESSHYFGNVYACWIAGQGTGRSGEFPFAIMFSRSTDGGEHWSGQSQLSSAANINLPVPIQGRQYCTVRTDSKGVVYVFFAQLQTREAAQVMTRSFDGGRSFERPRPVAAITEVGAYDSFHSFEFFDGVRGARTNSGPSVAIANGAPTGRDATDEIVLTWPDARLGLGNEEALLQYSTDGGNTWSPAANVAATGDRPNFPAVAISPNGRDVYLTYEGFLDPYRLDTSKSRRVQGVVRHADVPSSGANKGQVGGFQTVYRGTTGDARASSEFSLRIEFLGDYQYAVATNTYGALVWTDLRGASLCPAINSWRQSLLTNPPESPPPAPAPGTDCPSSFGNTDIFSQHVADPTP